MRERPGEIEEGIGMTRIRAGWLVVFLATTDLLFLWSPAVAFRSPDLTPAQEVRLKKDFAPCLSKRKGPYSENFCVCRKSGDKRPVMDSKGRITSPCGSDAMFCAAFRAPWAESLGEEGVWVANIFSRDLWLWPEFSDHHDLVRGYVLEKYFIDTNPDHKLAVLRAYGGLSGSEYETGASTRLFERYLDEPGYDDSRHFPLSYELQRRFFVRDDIGQVEKVRNMAVRIQAVQPKFKPLRDAIHNQLSAGLIPKLAAYRATLGAGRVRDQVDELQIEISKLTALDDGALVRQLAELDDAALQKEFTALLPHGDATPVAAMTSLGRFMLLGRRAVAARRVSTPDVRRLVDLNITAAAVMQARGSALLESSKGLSVREYVELLGALADAAYGSGLLVTRELEAATQAVDRLLATPDPARGEFTRNLQQVGRVVEWAQVNAVLPYADVWSRWVLLMPQVVSIGDDILRSSPMLLFAEVFGRLDDYADGGGAKRHEFFGKEVAGDVRVLNPGLAVGKLKLDPEHGAYSRNEIIALAETPAELEPAAGILTQGEGNVLSHVQLLARSLGIPNVVLGDSTFGELKPHRNEDVLFVATPGGRSILKKISDVTPAENAVWADYTGNDPRRGHGGFGAGSAKLTIDINKIDLTRKLPIGLDEVRRSDSGRVCGPKGAFLGELKHLFPDKVARGIVVPFGAYREHYDRARVAVPQQLRGAKIATEGEPLSTFVERTFGEFFDVLIPAGKDARALSSWIAPRLDVVRHSIEKTPLSPELRAAIRDDLGSLGLLRDKDKTETVGCFVRSDTNVEDLDTFNGAGLNLTLFNMGSLEDIYEGLRKVWASPFELRSFSWRQTLIDQPLWVLPSVVILESIPSDKSGVLVTCDIETGARDHMVVATSEGVGGAVDGASAETLRWSATGVELLTLYKSPWKTALLPDGGTGIVPSSGKDEVLSADELRELVAAGQAVEEELEPARDFSGNPRPWDIEFGFSSGKLWLFQSRPFIGNESVKNVPALAKLDAEASAGASDLLSLSQVLL